MKKFVEGFMSVFGCFCGLIASVGGLCLIGDIAEKYEFYKKHYNKKVHETYAKYHNDEMNEE